MPRAAQRSISDCTLRRKTGSPSARKYGRLRKDSCTSTTMSACFMCLGAPYANPAAIFG